MWLQAALDAQCITNPGIYKTFLWGSSSFNDFPSGFLLTFYKLMFL